MSNIFSLPNILILAIVALFAVAALGRASDRPQSFTGRTYVIDGDTLAFGKIRVRLFGIDAPEMGQDQGPASKAHLVELVRGETLTVTPRETDRFGRIVATVAFDDGIDLAGMMVAQGYARAYTRYGRDYVRLEKAARRERVGIWATAKMQDGADYRRSN